MNRKHLSRFSISIWTLWLLFMGYLFFPKDTEFGIFVGIVIALLLLGLAVIVVWKTFRQEPILLKRPVNNGVIPDSLVPEKTYYLNGYELVVFKWAGHLEDYIFQIIKEDGSKELISLDAKEVKKHVSAIKEIF